MARAEVQPHCRLQGPVCLKPTVLWEHLLVTTYQFPFGQDGGWILFALSTRSPCTDLLSALYSWPLSCPGSAEVAAVLMSGSFRHPKHSSPDLQPPLSAPRVLLPTRLFDAQSQLDVLSCQLSQRGPSPFQSCHRPRFHDNRGRVRSTSVALTDTLLSEIPWQLDPPLPLGLAIVNEAYVCAVAETRYQAVGFRQSHPEEDITRVAAAFGLSQHQLILLYAEPPILDVCVKGLRCTNVCSAISASDMPHLTYPDMPNVSFLDCRALLQGWHLLFANPNTVSFQEFEDSFAVFCPEGWELHIEGLPLDTEGYAPRPKQIAYASYVMQPRPVVPSTVEQADSEVPTDDESVRDTEGDADDDSPHRADQSSAPMRSRSRSPRGASGPDRRSGARNNQAIGREASGTSTTHGAASPAGQALPTGRARHARHVPTRAHHEHTEAAASSSARPRVWTRFLLYAPETAPELIDVQIAQGATVNDAVHAVQCARTRDARLRYPDVFPSELQPLPHLAVAITLPAWCASTYILLDCTRCNGALFCALSSPATTRLNLLAIARLPSDTGIEVFVHDRPTRLEDGEVIDVRTGMCVNFVPSTHSPFAVARLEDMLEDPHSWDLTADLPHVEGRWIYVLTDTEPIHLRPDLEGNRSFREQIASALECQPEHLAIQPSRPRLWDYFDFGILAHTVSIASHGVTGPSAAEPDRAFFILDMRPILCGVSWGFAPHGAVRAQELIDRLHRFCPVGRHTRISGGTPTQQDGEQYYLVSRGCVLVVDFSTDDPPSSETASVNFESSDGEPDAYPGPPRGPPRPQPLATTGQAQASQGRSTGNAPEDPASRPDQGTSRNYYRSFAVPGKAGGSVLALIALGAAFWAVCAITWLVRGPGPAPPPELLIAITGLFWFRFRALGVALCIISCATGAGAMQIHGLCRSLPTDTTSALPFSCGGPYLDERGRRPLPTPCRAGLDRIAMRAPTHEDLIVATSDLRTLLEESVARPDSQAMFLASTLVETLCDHFTVHFEDEPSGPLPDLQTAPRPVRLQDHIPVARQFDLTGVQLHVGFGPSFSRVRTLLSLSALRPSRSTQTGPMMGPPVLGRFMSPGQEVQIYMPLAGSGGGSQSTRAAKTTLAPLLTAAPR